MSVCLVADIGGTNGRFAIFDGHTFQEFKVFKCADFSTLQEMLSEYLLAIESEAPKAAVIAVATYVAGDQVSFTNLPWSFSVKALAKHGGFDMLKVINDFTSISIAVPTLQDDQLAQVGGVHSICDDGAKAIIGPGTGLGVSGLFRHEDIWVPIQGQGGHIVWGAVNTFEQSLFDYISQKKQPISAENLLCGSGIRLLYESICAVKGEKPCDYSNADIVTLGTNDKDDNCAKTVELFCSILGRIAGDVTLILGARSGVYIGGGIVSHMTDFLISSGFFRESFQQKGSMSSYIENIPVYIITEAKVGLIGAVECRKDEYNHIGTTYIR